MMTAPGGRSSRLRLACRWDKLNSDHLAGAALFLVALVIRSYRLSENPLWLDEIYGYQLAQRGIVAILRNSLVDPHPPLYYILLWAGSAFGHLHTEWAWRWLSVGSGALTVPLVFCAARAAVQLIPAFLSALLLALSPAHLYFSQEARSVAFVTCLAALTTILVMRVAAQPNKTGSWVALTLASVVGLCCAYNYVMVVAVQCAWLVLRHRGSRHLRPYTAAMITVAFGTLLIGGKQLASIATVRRPVPPLTVLRAAETLLSDDATRYGSAPLRTTLALLLLAVAGLGIAGGVRMWKTGTQPAFYIVQAVLPFAAFFGIAMPVLGLTLPPSEAKQFMVLLPSWFVLIAIGIDSVRRALGRYAGTSLLIVCLGVLLVSSLARLNQYWSVTKSPEGVLAKVVQSSVQPADAVISLHYSLDAALSFYPSAALPYTRPQLTATTISFGRSTAILRTPDPTPGERTPLTIIRRQPRIWLLALHGTTGRQMALLLSGCQSTPVRQAGQFVLLLLAGCS